jgi:hypothetical protein
MIEGETPGSGDQFTYSYRPTVFGAGWNFRLTPTAIAWDLGRMSGQIPYRDVRLVRMSFRPSTMQPHRFITEVWGVSGPKIELASTSWKSLVEQERFDKGYAAFVAELHRRVASSGAQAEFESGGNRARYWMGLTLFVGAALALAALTVRAIQTDAWGAAAFIGVSLIFFLWQAGIYFKRNRPSRYDPDSLPSVLIP